MNDDQSEEMNESDEVMAKEGPRETQDPPSAHHFLYLCRLWSGLVSPGPHPFRLLRHLRDVDRKEA